MSRPQPSAEAALVALLAALAAVALIWPSGAGGSRLARGAFDLALLYVGLLAAIVGAVRRPRDGDLRAEPIGFGGVVLATGMGALAGHLTGAALAGAGSVWTAWPSAAAVPALACAVGYPVARGAVLAWPVWSRLRRTRLLWSITHAQLLAALALAVGAALLLTLADLAARGPVATVVGASPPSGDGAVTPVWLVLRVLPAATALLLLATVAGLVVLPPAALISYLALRGPTRRLGELALAAEALRRGDFSVRVAPDGEDEVARLQASFTAMARDLAQNLEALQAERDRVTRLLEARRELVASVSHELRTPVATVRGYLETSLARGTPTAADLEAMRGEVARLERLIDDLFALARAEVGQLAVRAEPTDVGAIVERLTASVAPLAWAQRRVEVLSSVDADLPLALADPRRLEQVVSNLLSNAVRHTPPGGVVVAAVEAGPDGLVIEVSDTGAGIPAEELPRVFERFHRGDASEGAGLGLALVRELAGAMGGHAWAESTEGEGSRFFVRLRRAQG